MRGLWTDLRCQPLLPGPSLTFTIRASSEGPRAGVGICSCATIVNARAVGSAVKPGARTRWAKLLRWRFALQEEAALLPV